MDCVGTWPIDVGCFSIYRGDSWVSPPVRLHETLPNGSAQPVDASGWAFRAQLRSGREVLDVAIDYVEVPAAGDLPAAVAFTLSLTPEQTRSLKGGGVWDLEGTRDGVVRTWLRGTTRLVEDVTRDD